MLKLLFSLPFSTFFLRDRIRVITTALSVAVSCLLLVIRYFLLSSFTMGPPRGFIQSPTPQLPFQSFLVGWWFLQHLTNAIPPLFAIISSGGVKGQLYQDVENYYQNDLFSIFSWNGYFSHKNTTDVSTRIRSTSVFPSQISVSKVLTKGSSIEQYKPEQN